MDSEDDSIADTSVVVVDESSGGSTDDEETNKVLISDSDDSSFGRTSIGPSVASISSASTEDGRLTPLIRKAIRRSIHNFAEESFRNKADSENSQDEDDNSDDGELIRTQKKKVMVIEENTSDEDDVSEKSESPVEKLVQKQPRDRDIVESEDDGNDSYDEHDELIRTQKKKVMVIEENTSDEDDVSEKSESPVEKLMQKQPRDRDIVESEDDGNDSYDEHDELIRTQKKKVMVIEDDTSDEDDVAEKSESPVEKLVQKRSHDRDYIVESEDDDDDSYDEDNVQNDHSRDSSMTDLLDNPSPDTVIAQKRTLLVHKRLQIETQLAKTKMIFETGNMDLLPDKGERLRQSIMNDEMKLATVTRELEQIQLQELHSIPPNIKIEKRAPLFKQNSLDINPAYLKPSTDDSNKELGKRAQETLQREQSLTVERLQDLHGSLVARPADDEKAEDPQGLKIPLMPHQKHALAWLLWREQQKPPGGVLADDMGLGKTLTMISLIMASIAKSEAGEERDEENEWQSSARAQNHLGGTLVVAPASLMGQWQAEVNNRCKHDLLSVELYHGNKRETNPRRLAKIDIVITTYNILSRAFKVNGVLYKIRWRRVILDEAHVIRNHKSQTSTAVCSLHANKRWALTGTPIHNKELDLYALLKFLQCSPFDDLRVWKRWVDNKNAAGHERLATVMKTLMLRRTKAELQSQGALEMLPEKNIEIIELSLDPEERLVYDKVMVYSRTLFAQFLAQRAEKVHMFELGAGKFDKPSWQTTARETQFTKAQNKLLSLHADVKSHDILVLLLRLRQVCCHPPLIKSMLDQEDIETTGLEETGTDADLLSKMGTLNLQTELQNEDDDIGVDERVSEHLLTSDNPVFDPKRKSSKIRAVLEKTKEIIARGDKMIIVSQWVGLLNIVADELDNMEEASYRLFTGNIAVKDRQGIMNEFNSRSAKPNILLLSLTAGGVGLNLVGANHLLLMDIHWNPQLESQAQDRIYRFGQKKNVFIYKYICTDTIEERIKCLQELKLELATAVLSGGGKVVGSKLSLDDIKSLFGL